MELIRVNAAGWKERQSGPMKYDYLQRRASRSTTMVQYPFGSVIGV
jgi:hypothetical protein